MQIWINQPYQKNVKTDVCKVILKLLKKHFPANYILHTIFNKSTAKFSYSCMKNTKSAIYSHNRNILNLRAASLPFVGSKKVAP